VIYLDLDDFCEPNQDWDLLEHIKRGVPGFKVTLFSIPAYCSQEFIVRMQAVPWIDLVPHGWLHQTSRECENWSYERMRAAISHYERLGFTTKGWKAPGWQVSDGCYQALLDCGWWIADQAYNNHRRPAGLKAYILDRPERIHGHIGNWGGQNTNTLANLVPELFALKDEEFGFVRDAEMIGGM